MRTLSVICLSSVTHHKGCAEWESAVGGHVGFPLRSTYADSKLAMVLFAKVRAVNADEAFCPPPLASCGKCCSMIALDGISIVTLPKTAAVCFIPSRFVSSGPARS